MDQNGLEILRTELRELRRCVEEDDDAKDHWSDGRWPAIHRLARFIDDVAAGRRGLDTYQISIPLD